MQGLVVANLSPAVAEEMGLPTASSGVIALDVGRGVAQRFFKKGDIVLDVNGSLIANVEDLKQVISGRPDYWEIQISRGGRKLQMTLR